MRLLADASSLIGLLSALSYAQGQMPQAPDGQFFEDPMVVVTLRLQALGETSWKARQRLLALFRMVRDQAMAGGIWISAESRIPSRAAS